MKLYRAHLLKNPFASCCPNPLIANWKEMVFRRIIIWSFIIVLYSTWYTLIGLWTSKWTSFWPEYWSYPTSYWGEITLNFMVSETLTHNAHADAKLRSQIWYHKITNVFIIYTEMKFVSVRFSFSVYFDANQYRSQQHRVAVGCVFFNPFTEGKIIFFSCMRFIIFGCGYRFEIYL